MTPEQHLADVQRRFDDFIDDIISDGPPTSPWTMGDARALFSPGYDIAAEMVDALVALAKVSIDQAAAADFKRQAAALPSQFGFFAETIISHWRRLESDLEAERRGLTMTPSGKDSTPQKPTVSPMDQAVTDLLNGGKITPEQLRQAREVQKIVPNDLSKIIHDLGFASEREIAAARARVLGLQFVDLSRTRIEPDAAARVPAHIARRYKILPIRLDAKSSPNKLMIAVGDIHTSMAGLDEVRLASGCQITPVLAAPSDIADAIERVYGKPPK